MSEAQQGPGRRFSGRWRGLGLLAAPGLALVFGCHPLNLNPLGKDRSEAPKTVEKRDAAPGGPPPVPSEYSFRIAPYVFLSDFAIKRDQSLFRELAQLRDQVCKELLLPASTTEVRVYLFETKDRYERYLQANYPTLPMRRAYFIAQPRPGDTEELRVCTYWGERIRQDLRHELTHALLHSVLRDVPIWLDEDLAEYFELPTEQRGTNSVYVEDLQKTIAGAYRLDLARLESLKEVAQMNRAEYREAWAWVHLMLRSRPEARTVLLSYLQQLRGPRKPAPLRSELVKVFAAPEEMLHQHLDRLQSHMRPVQRAGVAVRSGPEFRP